MLKIGIPIWYNSFKEIKKPSLFIDLVEIKTSNIVNYFEISIDYPWPYRDTSVLKEFIKECFSRGYSIGVHAPWRDLFYATPYDALHGAMISVVNDVLEFFKDYSIDYIVLHITTSQKLQLSSNKEDVLKNSREIIGLIRKALPRETILVVENIPSGYSSTPQDLVEIVDNTEAHIALDIGHLATTYYKHYIDNYNTFIDYLKDALTILESIGIPLVHIHDVVFGKKGDLTRIIDHVIPGYGVLEWKSILKLLRDINPYYVLIEAFNDERGKQVKLESLLTRIREFLTWLRIYL